MYSNAIDASEFTTCEWYGHETNEDGWCEGCGTYPFASPVSINGIKITASSVIVTGTVVGDIHQG